MLCFFKGNEKKTLLISVKLLRETELTLSFSSFSLSSLSLSKFCVQLAIICASKLSNGLFLGS
jgi:hypothetical protein